MTATELLRDLRRLGVGFRIDGDRLFYRPVAKVPPGLREEIRSLKDELVQLIHPDDPVALARSELVRRCTAVWPWIADHRPDLFDRVMQTDKGPEDTDVAAFERVLRSVIEAFDAANPRGGAVRLHVPSIEHEVWVVADEGEAAAFTAAIQMEGDGRAVFSAAEVERLRDQPTQIMASTERVKRVIGGRLLEVGSHVEGKS